MLSMSAMCEEDGVVVQEADDIATKMIGILVEKFKEREGRDPNADEVGQLLEELTEDRVAELLGMEQEKEEPKEVSPKTTFPSSTSSGCSSSTTEEKVENSNSDSVSTEIENESADDHSSNQEADDIASGILGILVAKFKEKTGVDPTEQDIEKMLEEMTEERVAELLVGTVPNGDDDDADDSKRKPPVVEGREEEAHKKQKLPN